METLTTDPGKPGLYECHFVYCIGKAKHLLYTVVLLTAPNFKRAYNMGVIQLECTHTHDMKGKAIHIEDNLINLITDPLDYIAL